MKTLAAVIGYHADRCRAAVEAAQAAQRHDYRYLAKIESVQVSQHTDAVLTLQDVQKLYARMRNVAVSYSNLCDETRSTRRLDAEFEAIEAAMRVLKGGAP